MKFKTFLLLLLSLSILLTLLVSCNGKNNEATTTVASKEEDITKEEQLYKTVDFSDAEGNPGRYTILARTERSDYLVCEESSIPLNQAVYQRNELLNEQFNIEIELIEGGHSEGSEFSRRISADIGSGDGAYDLVCPTWWWGTELTVQGAFYNFLDFDSIIDLNDSWWISGWNDQAQISNCMLQCMSDAQMDTYFNLECIIFNKKLADTINADLYTYVYSKEWTLEKMAELGRMVKNTNGAENMTPGISTYGCCINRSSASTSLTCLGQKLTEYEGEGNWKITLANEHNYDIFKKFYEFCWEEDSTLFLSGEAYSTLHEDTYKYFAQEQVLFLAQCFRVVPLITNISEVSYGMLPFPLYDGTQEDYISTSYDSTTFVLLTTTPNPVKSVTILNAMSALSYDIVTEVYFEKTIGLRYSSDQDTHNMVEIVHRSLLWDFANIHYSELNVSSNLASKYALNLFKQNKDCYGDMSTAQKQFQRQLNQMQEYYVDVLEMLED